MPILVFPSEVKPDAVAGPYLVAPVGGFGNSRRSVVVTVCDEEVAVLGSDNNSDSITITVARAYGDKFVIPRPCRNLAGRESEVAFDYNRRLYLKQRVFDGYIASRHKIECATGFKIGRAHV